MKLSEAGEGRIRGYLHLLKQSLRSFMPSDLAADSVREVESHIREKLEELDEDADERAGIERVLTGVGPPLDLARVYASELTLDEAAATGRVAPLLRSLWLLAATTVSGFVKALVYFTGYAVGLAFLALAPMKVLFPDNVGVVVRDGIPRAFGGRFPVEEGTEIVGGLGLVPFCLVLGMLLILVTPSCRAAHDREIQGEPSAGALQIKGTQLAQVLDLPIGDERAPPSGVYFTLDAAPSWLQKAVFVLPLLPSLKALRAVFNDGADLSGHTLGLCLVLAWGITGFGLAVKRFRWA